MVTLSFLCGRRCALILIALFGVQGCGSGDIDHVSLAPTNVGGFLFELADNRLSIRLEEQESPVWVTPADGKLLAANETALSVRDSRSSYTINERVIQGCESPEIDDIVVKDSRITFFGAFLDCESVTFALSFANHKGQLRFELSSDSATLNHLTLRYQSTLEERFYGFGEQYSFVDLKGQNIPVLTQEQGVGRGEPLLSTLVNLFSPGSSGTPLTSYYSVPHYISSERTSVFLENTEYSRFDLRAEETVAVHVFAPVMTGQLLVGERMLDLIEGFTGYAGRMSALPEWANRGAILGVQGGTDSVRRVWALLRDHDTPIGAFWLQDWVGKRQTLGGAGSQLWWNWELDEDRYPHWDELVDDFHDEGIRALGYINPFLVDAEEKGNVQRNLYQEALSLGYLVNQEDGAPYPIEITDFDAGIVDLTHPGARRWMKDVIIDQMVGQGLSGWMADFGEALPFEATLFDGSNGFEFHNKYPVEWAKLNAEAVAEVGLTDDVLFFMRSGFTTSPAYSSAFWLGDQAVTWDHYDGLKSAVIGLLNGGFSGLSINHSDIGGYTSLTFQGVGLKRSEELLLRWIEVNAFTAMFRSHEGLAPDSSAQVYSNDRTLGQFARFAMVYSALAEYRNQLFVEAETKGYPLVRHPLLHFEEDAYFQTMDKDNLHFMLGEQLIIAPVMDKGVSSVEVHLPAGQWVNFWKPEDMIDAPFGGVTFMVEAPIGSPAVYIQRKSLLLKRAVEALIEIAPKS